MAKSGRKTRPTWENVLGAVGSLETRSSDAKFFQVLKNKACQSRHGHENEDLPTAFARRESWAIETACDALTRCEDFCEMAPRPKEKDRVRLRELRRKLEDEVE